MTRRVSLIGALMKDYQETHGVRPWQADVEIAVDEGGKYLASREAAGPVFDCSNLEKYRARAYGVWRKYARRELERMEQTLPFVAAKADDPATGRVEGELLEPIVPDTRSWRVEVDQRGVRYMPDPYGRDPARIVVQVWGDWPRAGDDPEPVNAREGAEEADYRAGQEDETHEAQVRAMLLLLPQDLRVVLMLRAYSGLTQKQVAEKLGVHVNTVANRERAGLRMLQDLFESGAAEAAAWQAVGPTLEALLRKSA
jgi:RNA polymerase sigma factor (sigma-70 family)